MRFSRFSSRRDSDPDPEKEGTRPRPSDKEIQKFLDRGMRPLNGTPNQNQTAATAENQPTLPAQPEAPAQTTTVEGPGGQGRV